MTPYRRRSWLIFLLLLAANALLAFLIFILGLADEMAAAGPATASMPEVPQWILGAANAGLILVIYGTLGALGITLSFKMGLPAIYHEHANRRELFSIPMVLGLLCGVFLIVVDRAFAITTGREGFTHPIFPASLIASATAGIGEEIVFRLFLLTLWLFLLRIIFKRHKLHNITAWAANGFAALVFAAAHIPATMFILGAHTPAEIPLNVLSVLLILNSFLALVAGERFLKDGLVAAVGVHFWADIVWHVVYPMLLP
jgi:hypothetical protein